MRILDNVNMKKLKLHKRLSLLTIVIGIAGIIIVVMWMMNPSF